MMVLTIVVLHVAVYHAVCFRIPVGQYGSLAPPFRVPQPDFPLAQPFVLP